MKAEDAKRLRELLEKATPGPWRVPCFADNTECPCGYINSAGQRGAGAIAEVLFVNARLICEAINALPSLLALYGAVMGLPKMPRPELHEIEGDMEDYALNNGRAMGWNECREQLRRLVPDCGSGE